MPHGMPPLAQVGPEVVVVVLVDVVVVVLVVEVVLVVLVVVLVEVVVVVVGHTSVTMPPPSVVTAGWTQLVSTRFCGEPPSGHAPALVSAAENFPVAFGMHPTVSTGSPFAAAFE
jgi:hypothetical protein